MDCRSGWSSPRIGLYPYFYRKHRKSGFDFHGFRLAPLRCRSGRTDGLNCLDSLIYPWIGHLNRKPWTIRSSPQSARRSLLDCHRICPSWDCSVGSFGPSIP